MPEQDKSREESGICFGSHRLDLLSGQLWRGKQEVKVAGKVFAVLRYFVEHPGQLVNKDDLFAAVWPDTVVSDATLASCIQDLRQALGDKAKKPRYIETVHGRGYRFVAAIAAPVSSSEFQVPSQEEGGSSQEPEFRSQNSEVRIQEEDNHKPVLSEVEGATGNDSLESSAQSLESENQNSSLLPAQALDARRQTLDVSARFTRSLVLAAALLLTATILTVQYLSRPSLSTQSSALITQEAQLPLPDKPSLIVLPLVNLSGDPEQEYFSDGLTEVLTGDLSRISSLFVIARNSAFTYKGKATKVQDVSKEMGVRYVLEGSVQRANQRIRIAVQLIDATTGYHLWSEQYDRPLKDIFALQDEIVRKIVTTLKLQLTLEEQGLIVRKHTNNLEAYDAFLHGVEYWWRYTPEANAQARQLFEKAVALDPQYAEAYEWLSVTYWIEWSGLGSADPQALERASELAQKAATLDDSLPTAHWGLSHIYAAKQQYDQAIAEGERAIALDPNDADSYAVEAEALNFAGRPEDALRVMAQATRLNPRYPFWYLMELGWAYRLAGRYAEAISTLKELVSRNPDFLGAHAHLAISYVAQWTSQLSQDPQTLEQALAEAQRILALNGDSSPWGHGLLGTVYLLQKQYEPAIAEMERVIALTPNGAGGYAGLAEMLSRVGRSEEALQMVAQALSRNPSVDAYRSIGNAYYLAGRPEEAIAPLKQYLARNPNFLVVHLSLVAVYSELGQDAEARAEAAEVLRLNPNFSLEVARQRSPVKDPAVAERGIAALRKAGLK